MPVSSSTITTYPRASSTGDVLDGLPAFAGRNGAAPVGAVHSVLAGLLPMVFPNVYTKPFIGEGPVNG